MYIYQSGNIWRTGKGQWTSTVNYVWGMKGLLQGRFKSCGRLSLWLIWLFLLVSTDHLARLEHFYVTNIWFISTKKIWENFQGEEAVLTSCGAASDDERFLTQQAGSPAPHWPPRSSKPHWGSPSLGSPKHHTWSGFPADMVGLDHFNLPFVVKI